MMKKKVMLGALMGALLVANGAFAAENLSTYSLDQMVVTATKDEVKDLEVPAMTQIYSADEIERTGAHDVLEFVKNTLGAEVTDVSAPAKNGVHFRGNGSASRMRTSALVLIDGVPINIQGRADLPGIPTAVIKRIEIINGGGSVLYGTDAVDGGVVNIITKEKFDGQASYGYGTHGKRIADFSYGAGDEKTTVNFAWAHNRLGERGHDNILGANANPTKVRYGGKYDGDSFVVTAKHDDHLKFIGMYKDFSNDYYYKNATKSYNDPIHTSQLYNVGYENKDLKANVYYKKYKLGVDEYSTKGRKLTAENRSRVYGVDVNHRFHFKNLDVLIGGNFENEHILQSMGKYSRTQNTEAIYLMLDAQLTEQTKLSVGGRQLFVEDLGNKFCPQINVLHKLSEDDSLFINANKAYRTPLGEELFGNASHGYTGNLDLRPETGWLTEFGYKRNIKNGTVKAAIFHSKIDDRISKDKTKTFVNKDEFKNTGIEVTVNQKLSKLWNYSLGFTYANPKEATDGVWEQADYKLGITSQLGYTVGKFGTTLNTQFWDKIADIDNSAINFNLNVKYAFDNHHSLKFNVFNFNDSDKKYCDMGSLPKRSVYAVYTYNF